ncbi:hypothetical protein [Treponema sp. C6A8]|uniref:hypothetical protein n=1 Tax=Treponema sp. C6A8 TaxID=1410609 RepID=UPI000ADD290B|nr:hypothetical protein [Treponema sp. C6A8]
MAVLAAMVSASLFAAPKGKAPKMKAGTPVVVDYQGQALGSEIPAWVVAIGEGSQKKVRKSLEIDKEDAIFILQNKGSDLDFLKAWTDQIDVRAEVASSIEQTVAQAVIAELDAKDADEQTKTRAAKIYSTSMTNLTLNGLTKDSYYWIKTRTMKPGVKKITSEADYTDEYTYYVVFTMNRNLYDAQLNAAIRKVDDNDESTQFLKEVLAMKICESVVMPKASGYDYSGFSVEEIDY